jgi:hypothetical protein
MSIRVTCTGCHTRFNVSEKFAGREGPCPKCRRVIRIPAAADEVKVHAPENFGPKGATGEAILKPIFRQDTILSPVQIVLIAAVLVGFVAIAFLLRWGISDKEGFSSLLLAGLSIVVALPCVFAGYTVLRDQELGSLSGQDLGIRVAACAVIYGLAWSAFSVSNLALMDDFGTTTRIFAIAAMFVIGAVAANLFLGLDLIMATLHFGLFLGCCILLRVIIGFSALPGPVEPGTDKIMVALLSQLNIDALHCLFG